MALQDQLGRPVLFHMVLWHGKDGISTSIPGYDSRDPKVIKHQLQAMLNLGGDNSGVIVNTYGPTVSSFIHEACMNVFSATNALGMPFALCMDPWTVKGASNKDSAMIAALKNADIQFILNSETYLPGKPVLDFSTGCDAKTVLAGVPGIEYWMEQQDFDWVQIQQVANKTNLPCAYVQFNDGTGPNRNMSVWDQSKPVRLVPSMAGATYGSRVSRVGLPPTNAYIQFATWNDYSEGTEIEPFASMLWGKI